MNKNQPSPFQVLKKINLLSLVQKNPNPHPHFPDPPPDQY